MVNHTTHAQRYNARMDKIFEEAKNELPSSLNNFYWRKGKVVKRGAKKEWTCSKASLGNNDWECESQRGTAVSMSGNGSIRFTKFDCDIEVKVDGKIQKGKCGVELN